MDIDVELPHLQEYGLLTIQYTLLNYSAVLDTKSYFLTAVKRNTICNMVNMKRD